MLKECLIEAIPVVVIIGICLATLCDILKNGIGGDEQWI